MCSFMILICSHWVRLTSDLLLGELLTFCTLNELELLLL